MEKGQENYITKILGLNPNEIQETETLMFNCFKWRDQ